MNDSSRSTRPRHSMPRQLLIRRMRDGEDAACERILRGLPDWFGIESAIVDYVRDLLTMETWVAEDSGSLVGFLAIRAHNRFSAEIHVMAVDSTCHGRGCGRQMVEFAEESLRSRSIEYLQVKTLAPSRPSVHYERTRGFYDRMGFRPLEENLLWGEQNPCLIMVKHLGCLRDDH